MSLPDYILLCATQSKDFVVSNRAAIDSLLNLWSDEYLKLLQIAVGHIDLHNEAIGSHLLDYIEEGAKGYQLAMYAVDTEAFAQVGSAYVSNQLHIYVGKTHMLATLPQVAKKVHAGDLEAAWKLLQDTRKSLEATKTKHRLLDEKTDYIKLLMRIYSDDSQQNLREMTYGIQTLDRIGFRPTRGTAGAWLAEPEIGKSAFACHITVVNAVKGKKVLYVNLEGPGEVVGARIALFATKLDYVRGVTTQLQIDVKGNGYLEKIAPVSIPEGLHLADITPKQLEQYSQRMESISKNFRVLTYSPSSLDAETLQLEIYRMVDDGWCPDIVILDHLAHMKLPENYEAAKFAVEEYTKKFLSLAVELNLSFEIFHQPSVYGDSLAAGKVLTFAEHAANSKALKVPLARAITMQSTPMEKDAGLIRLFIEKNRSSLAEKRSGCMVLTSSNFKKGLVGNYSCLWKGKSVERKDLPDQDGDI